jgi:8-oxo-dGTP diphosphatase
MNETAPGRVRVGAYGLCRDGDRVLLCRASASERLAGHWTLPGGGLRFGERPADAALRELTEETGLLGEIVDLHDVESYVRAVDEDRGAPTHMIAIVYVVRIIGGEMRAEVDESTDRCAWMTPLEVAAVPLFPLARSVLRTGPR